MKHIYTLLLFIAALSGITACDDGNDFGNGYSLALQKKTAPTTLMVSPTSLSFDASGGRQSVTVTSNTNWTVASDASWCTVNTSLGTDNNTINIIVAANTSTSRTATVTIKTTNGSKTATIRIEQEPGIIPGEDDNNLPKQW